MNNVIKLPLKTTTRESIDIIRPDDRKRFEPTTEGHLNRLGFHWLQAVHVYAIIPSDWSEEAAISAIEQSST